VCQPELKYINLALINIHYLIVDEADGSEIKLRHQILDPLLLMFLTFQGGKRAGLHPLS
jgi:hypothetical protein